MKAPKAAGGIAPIRKILLLTDGHLNAGITKAGPAEAVLATWDHKCPTR